MYCMCPRCAACVLGALSALGALGVFTDQGRNETLHWICSRTGPASRSRCTAVELVEEAAAGPARESIAIP